MKIVFIASECYPLAKVGGLGEVAYSLPLSLKKIGLDISIFLPFYKVISDKKFKISRLPKNNFLFWQGEKFEIFQTKLGKEKIKIPVYLIKNRFISNGGIYASPSASSSGEEEEAERFMLFSVASLEFISKIGLNPDIIHLNDWQTAIAAFLMKNKKCLAGNFKKTRSLLTIHNLGYQGIYPSKIVNKILGTDFKGKVNCLEQGILNADFITTVSPSYAKEILTKEFGCGLENSLKERRKNLAGVLNGIDTERFNPKTDKFLIKNYSLNSLSDKTENKLYLLKKYFKGRNLNFPLFSLISRLAYHKGIDLVMKIFDKLMKKNLYFILLGQGEKKYEKFFSLMNKKYQGKFSAIIDFDEKLAHQIYAGSDVFLIPSLFEPCGLTQMVSQRYGTIPLGRAVGGIKDTITPIKSNKNFKLGTGFLFEEYNSQKLLKIMEEAINLYQDRRIWRKIQINGMKKDFSWDKSAKKYKNLYKKITRYH